MPLLNRDFIREILLKDAGFARSHGAIAEKEFLSTALMIFSLVYMLPAKKALVLGSGAGFIPRIVRQAQREVPDEKFLSEAETLFVDACIEERSNYQFFCQEYPDVEFLRMTTDSAFEKLKMRRFDYLHIDADHTHAQSLKDFENYLTLMDDEFVITIHDTAIYYRGDGSVPQTIGHLRREMLPGGKYEDLEMINFNNLDRNSQFHFGGDCKCVGLALIKPKKRMLMDTSFAPIAAGLFRGEL